MHGKLKNTHCPKGHAYDEKNTKMCISKFGRPYRRCRTCLYFCKKRSRSKKWAKEYTIYTGAKGRCLNKNNQQYKYYGARGIKFLFKNFEEFKKTLGERPNGMELDRIDNDGHYEPNNVRWATKSQNINNRRHFIFSKEQAQEILQIKNMTRTSIAKKYGVSSHTICDLFKRNGRFYKPWQTLKD